MYAITAPSAAAPEHLLLRPHRIATEPSGRHRPPPRMICRSRMTTRSGPGGRRTGAATRKRPRPSIRRGACRGRLVGPCPAPLPGTGPRPTVWAMPHTRRKTERAFFSTAQAACCDSLSAPPRSLSRRDRVGPTADRVSIPRISPGRPSYLVSPVMLGGVLRLGPFDRPPVGVSTRAVADPPVEGWGVSRRA
jgi:hypothetical protein